MNSDSRPFLDTIRAAMARDDQDAGPWLVYADWLEERGECALAELIRTACELETLGPGRPVIPCIAITVESRKTGSSVTAHTAGAESWINTMFADERELVIRATAYRDKLPPTLGDRTPNPADTGVARLVTRNTMSAEPPCELDVVVDLMEFQNGPFVRLTATPTEPDPHAARRDAAMQRVGELERVVERSTLFFRGISPVLTWRRGLVIELSAEWRAWLAHGDAIMARHPVTAVQFSGGEIGSTEGEFIAKELRERWPGVAFSWRHADFSSAQRVYSRDIIDELLSVQSVRPGDTLEWLPMWRGEDDRGGDGGPAS